MNSRPTGVTILAILAFVGGILSVLASLALLGFSGLLASAGYGGLAFMFGLYTLVWGVLSIWIGLGFWQLRPSAWRWGIILFVINFAISIIEYPLGYAGAGLGGGIGGIVIAIAVLYYLTTPGVRAAFGQPTGGGMMDAVMGAFGMGGGKMGMTSAPPPAPPAPPMADDMSGGDEEKS